MHWLYRRWERRLRKEAMSTQTSVRSSDVWYILSFGDLMNVVLWSRCVAIFEGEAHHFFRARRPCALTDNGYNIRQPSLRDKSSTITSEWMFE
jgi:hypothetical protein